jgi:hypothetical protein
VLFRSSAGTEVLKELLAKPEAPAPTRAPVTEAPKAPDAVDRGVIEDLLGDSERSGPAGGGR